MEMTKAHKQAMRAVHNGDDITEAGDISGTLNSLVSCHLCESENVGYTHDLFSLDEPHFIYCADCGLILRNSDKAFLFKRWNKEDG